MPTLPTGKRFKINDSEFYFSVAETGVELMTGLRGATNLEGFDGMLFDFGCGFDPIMTPKGLQFPVDIAFILESGEIVMLSQLDPMYGINQKTDRSDIQYVLEVPVGFFEANGIEIGTIIEL